MRALKSGRFLDFESESVIEPLNFRQIFGILSAIFFEFFRGGPENHVKPFNFLAEHCDFIFILSNFIPSRF